MLVIYSGASRQKQMATPFVPVPVQVSWTRSGGCRSRPRRMSPSGSPSSSSSGSSPPGRIPWIRGAGSRGNTVACPSLPRPGSSPEGYGRRTRGAAEGSSSSPVLEDGSPRDSWVERPITPTLLGHEIMEERAKITVRIKGQTSPTEDSNITSLWG